MQNLFLNPVKTFFFVILFLTNILAGTKDTNTGKNLNFNGQWFISWEMGNKDKKKYNNFQLKRGYVTIKNKFNEKLSGRITQDITIDKEGDGRGDVELRLKYCYLKYKTCNLFFLNKPYVEIGMVHRPWMDYEQKINTYRLQEKMFLDKNSVISSAGFGITWGSMFGNEIDKEYQKKINSKYPGKYGSICLGIYNGGGYHAIEENTNKTFESRISIRPLANAIPGLQISHTGAFGKGNTDKEPDFLMNAGFVSYETYRLILTGMYFHSIGNYKGSVVDNNDKAISNSGYSVFTQFKIFPKSLSLIGRYDRFKIESEDVEDIAIFGIAYNFLKGNKVMLNYETDIDKDFISKCNYNIECGIELKF